MSVLAFDPYDDDTYPLTAKVAKPAKHEEIRQFPGAKIQEAAANQAKPPDGGLASLAGGGEGLAPGNPQKTSTLAGLAGLAVSDPQSVKTDASTIVPCSRCGTTSRPFIDVVNPEGWLCDGCWPAWPDDAAAEQEERAAIQSENAPAAPVLHQMPPSWSDMAITPTPGAICRCCRGRAWWTEATSPRGWRCSTCYPGDHLPADRRREMVT